MFVGRLIRPSLARFSGLCHSYLASVSSTSTCCTGELWDDGRGFSFAAGYGAVVPSFVWVGGVTPGPWVTTRVSAVVFLKFFFPTSIIVTMVVWLLRKPTLAGVAIFCGGDFSSVVLSSALHTLLWVRSTARHIAVLPGSLRVSGVAPRLQLIVRVTTIVVF